MITDFGFFIIVVTVSIGILAVAYWAAHTKGYRKGYLDGRQAQLAADEQRLMFKQELLQQNRREDPENWIYYGRLVFSIKGIDERMVQELKDLGYLIHPNTIPPPEYTQWQFAGYFTKYEFFEHVQELLDMGISPFIDFPAAEAET